MDNRYKEGDVLDIIELKFPLAALFYDPDSEFYRMMDEDSSANESLDTLVRNYFSKGEDYARARTTTPNLAEKPTASSNYGNIFLLPKS